MIRSQSRGHEIYFDEQNQVWRYCDNNEAIREDRECKRCGRKPTKEGYDACKGYIEGAKSVCCGHGVTDEIKKDKVIKNWKVYVGGQFHSEYELKSDAKIVAGQLVNKGVKGFVEVVQNKSDLLIYKML